MLGARKLAIVSATLVPLWKPNARWDDVSADDRDTFKTDAYGGNKDSAFTSAEDSAFRERFHKQGKLHDDGENMIVGRLWGLDPAGLLDPAEYERNTGPFAPFAPFALYTPWDIPGVADQTRRKRPMLEIPTIRDGKPPLKVVLDFSYDGGLNWRRLPTGFRIFANDCAVFFKANDLLAIGREVFKKDNDRVADNWYDAYLSGALHVQATFMTELDERLVKTSKSTTSPMAAHSVSKLIIQEKAFGQLWSVERTGPSPIPDDIYDRILDRDDSGPIRRFASATLATREGAKWKGNPIIPWIETEQFALGTPIEGIRRRLGGPVEIEFGGSANRQSGFPVVIQKTYDVQAQSTMLTLEDHSMRKALAPPP